MARALRIEFEGAFYHVFSRGDKGDSIFNTKEKKKKFLECLCKAAETCQVEIYAYCVMGNHYHLLLQTKMANLSSFMHSLGSAYANFLKKEGWIGHVFSGRYKSLCVEKEEYLLTLSRYIHLNPVRAAIVQRPENYFFSSYRPVLTGNDCPSWLHREWIHDFFGPGPEQAQKRYREFVESDYKNGTEYPSDKVYAKVILGSREFTEKVLKMVMKNPIKTDVSGEKKLRRYVNLDDIYKSVCEYYELCNLSLSKGCLRGVIKHARKMFVYLAREYTPAINREIANMMGELSVSGITRQYERTKNDLSREEDEAKIWAREADAIMSNVKA